MKRIVIFLLTVATALMIGTTASAQTPSYPKNELAVSYAPLSNSDLFGVLIAIVSSFGEETSTSLSGSISLEYMRALSDLVSVGGIFSYYQAAVHQKDVTNRYSNYSLLAAVKLEWFRRQNFGMYSKAGIGASYHNWVTEGSPVTFDFQLSAIGIEAGPPFLRAFAEAGIGEQGVILAGIRFRF